VRHTGTLVARRLRGGSIETPVNLKGVASDDLATETLGDGDRQLRLAGSREATDDENGRPGRSV
jgi:hypothetical protein